MFRTVTINLADLPRDTCGNICWSQCIGYKLEYTVNETNYSGYFYITDSFENKVEIKLDEKCYIVTKSSILHGKIAKLLGIKGRVYKYKIGEILNDLEILEYRMVNIPSSYSGKVINSTRSGYLVRCMRDGYEFEILECHLSYRRGCPVCTGDRVLVGVNDLATVSPQLAKWFEDPLIPKTITRESNKKFAFKCPYCGRRFFAIPNRISTTEPSCVCRDGFSVPEKYFASVLNQLGIDFIPQLNRSTFSWCQNYKYDFYFPLGEKEYIVEIDGGIGHGHTAYCNSTEGYLKAIERDRQKDLIAKQNGIVLFRINANYPDIKTRFSFLMNEILSSPLFDILDLSKIDWNRCQIESEKSIVFQCAELWRENSLSIAEIAEKLKIGVNTAREYIKRCTEYGLINYYPNCRPPKKKKLSTKYLKVSTLDGDVIAIHDGIASFVRQSENIIGKKISTHQVYNSLRNQSVHNKNGLRFEYATEKEYLEFTA